MKTICRSCKAENLFPDTMTAEAMICGRCHKAISEGPPTKTMEQLENSRKKGWVAAVYNLCLPGAGYFYCGNYFLGIFVLPFFIAIAYNAVSMFGSFFGPALSLAVIVPSLCSVLAIDGFLAAGRANKKIDDQIARLMRKCPQCAEKVLPAAKICKHCGSTI